jgi:hypothetical protein
VVLAELFDGEWGGYDDITRATRLREELMGIVVTEQK